jgi:Phosphotransferase enzyme family
MSQASAQPQDLFQLAAVTPAELAAIATAAAGSPVARPVAHPAPIAYDWGSPVTAGLWRVEVTSDGEPACTLFVKLVRHTRLWPMLSHLPDEASRAEFVGYYPWHYELDIHQVGIESVLPDGMRMPVLHHVARPDDERPGGWELADYRLAARLLGQLAARRRAGAEVNKALPEVARNRASALRFYTSRRVISGVLPALHAGEIWHHPVLQAALGQAADPALQADMLALGERLPQLLDVLDDLPQTYAHGDASPQNLLLPEDEPGTIAIIDWGFGTLLPVGFDLGQLLVGLAHARDTDLSQLPAIDAEIFPAYLDGLASEDYKVDPAHVRTGYIGSLAARSALCAIPAEQLGSAEPTDDTVTLFARRIRLTRLMLDLAREV